MAIASTELQDRHRIKPRTQGGIYTPDNVVILSPRDHMAEHGILREERFEHLKAIMDDRSQVMKTLNKVNSQLLAYKRRVDHVNQNTVNWLTEEVTNLKSVMNKRDYAATKAVKELAEVDPLVKSALGVKGVGPVTIAMCTVYICIEKAKHASSVWKYAGLHCPSYDRYTKGEAGGGNKTLRTALYTMATSQIKCKGAYEEVYRNVKARLESSQKVTKSRNTQGRMVEVPWCETKPSHRHGAAIRAIMKHFLADYWYVGRDLAGLPNGPGYAEAQLGGNHKTIYPQERGWVW